ncbi:hypothetical protein ABPG75_001330 [Micractinium tetrahymenae]
MPPRGRLAPHTPGKGQLLAYEPGEGEPRPPAPQAAVAPRKRPEPLPEGEDLIFMATDIQEEGQGQGLYGVFGTTAQGASVLLRLLDFRPYFYIAAPLRQARPAADTSEGSGAGPRQAPEEFPDWGEEQLHWLLGVFNRQMPLHSKLESIEAVHRRPLLFYRRARPDNPRGGTFLRLVLPVGGSVKQAQKHVRAVMLSNDMRAAGLVWRDPEFYEHEVKSLTRLLVDLPVSGGAWLLVRGGSWRAAQPRERTSSCDVEATAPCAAVCCLTPDATQLADPSWSPFRPAAGSSSGAAEGEGEEEEEEGEEEQGQGQGARSRRGPSAAAVQAAAAAMAGDIAALRCLALDVLLAAPDASDRVAVAAPKPELGRPEGDPVVAIACTLFTTAATGNGGAGEQAAGPSAPPSAAVQGSSVAGAAPGSEEVESGEGGGSGEGGDEEGEVVAPGEAAPPQPATVVDAIRPGRATAAACAPGGQAFVFLLAPGLAAAGRREAAERSMAPAGAGGAARVLLFGSEEELLLAWAETVRAADPDVLACFQVNDTLAVLQQRFAALGLEPLKASLSRLLPHRAAPLAIKAVTQYSAQWVKRQSRMSTTSNQLTYKAQNLEGRLVVDVLRHCITAQSLETFSLVDCVHKLLGQTLEVLHPGTLAALAWLAGPQHAGSSAAASVAVEPPGEASAMRVARYALRRCDAVLCLLHRLATIPEMIESARATGLTLVQAMYQAQVVRVNSLLLRAAGRQGYLLPGQREGVDLQETTFIYCPEEARGMHRHPVAVLDFASLYPSIYRAHNMCYSTLLHRADLQALPPEQVTLTPTGEAFVRPEVRQGVLPGILSALVAARSIAREQLKAAADPATRAVLDGRQKALKLTSNAVYGFTATKISPLQSPEAADSCLAIGRESTSRAKDLVEQVGREGRLGPHGAGARVLYGHTDSIFVVFPRAGTTEQAIQAGRLAAQEVTSQFPPPMRLAFERVMHPFLLLHINRYAGAAFEKEEDAAGEGQLLVKGIKSMWRQTAPIIRTTLYGALQRLLLRNDPEGAADFAKGQIRRLLTGRVDMNELAMSGGLWRVTGEQVERMAAGTAGPSDEEVKGPHNSLAVRLNQRDPGRTFVLGERLQYVLLAGHKKQDDAAEDPLTAAAAGQNADYNLYWQKKMLTPLREIFEACLGLAQQHILQDLTGGDHTRVRVDFLAPEQPAALPGPVSPPPGPLRGRSGGRGGRGGRGGNGGRGTAAAPPAVPPAPQAQQRRLQSFFRQIPKCLSCRTNMPSHSMDSAPGLCDDCAGVEGRWEEAYLAALEEQAGEEARHYAAFAACRDCHSGGLAGAVLCANGECPVAYARMSTATRLRAADEKLRRLDIF